MQSTSSVAPIEMKREGRVVQNGSEIFRRVFQDIDRVQIGLDRWHPRDVHPPDEVAFLSVIVRANARVREKEI